MNIVALVTRLITERMGLHAPAFFVYVLHCFNYHFRSRNVWASVPRQVAFMFDYMFQIDV